MANLHLNPSDQSENCWTVSAIRCQPRKCERQPRASLPAQYSSLHTTQLGRHSLLRIVYQRRSPSMSLSMYQASVPAFLQMLKNLSAILDKAEAYAGSRKIAAPLRSRQLLPAKRLSPCGAQRTRATGSPAHTEPTSSSASRLPKKPRRCLRRRIVRREVGGDREDLTRHV